MLQEAGCCFTEWKVREKICSRRGRVCNFIVAIGVSMECRYWYLASLFIWNSEWIKIG